MSQLEKVTEFIRIVLNSFCIGLVPILRNFQLESNVCLYSVVFVVFEEIPLALRLGGSLLYDA